jgi:hypothetical protein
MDTNGTTRSSVFAALHSLQDLPAQLESGLKTHPFATAAAIAGVSFVGGTFLGSRLGRALLVAVAPAIVYHLLNSKFGDNLVGSMRDAFRPRPVESRTAS